MKTTTVVVEVSGGCVTEVHGLIPSQRMWVLLDWDNLLSDSYTVGDTTKEWDKFDAGMKAWIEANYPEEFAKIKARLAEDARDDQLRCEFCGETQSDDESLRKHYDWHNEQNDGGTK